MPLSLKAKLILCETYIRDVMTYALLVRAIISKSNMLHLQVVENETLRLIGGYGIYMQMTNGIQTPKF